VDCGKREGSRWIPKPFETLNDQALITRHLDLIIRVGAQVTPIIDAIALHNLKNRFEKILQAY